MNDPYQPPPIDPHTAKRNAARRLQEVLRGMTRGASAGCLVFGVALAVLLLVGGPILMSGVLGEETSALLGEIVAAVVILGGLLGAFVFAVFLFRTLR